MKSAYEDADKHNWTKAELEAYDYVLMREQDDRGRMSKAIKNAVSVAVKDAVKENSKEIARNLLSLGLSIENVAESTGLAVGEVRELKE